MLNPFDFSRYEAGRNPSVFVPDWYSKFESGETFLVAGTRGSGKTSLLKWLSWESRTAGPCATTNDLPFSDTHLLGMYARIVDYEMPVFAGLMNGLDADGGGEACSTKEDLAVRLFSNYLSLLHCALLCNALGTLAPRRLVPIDAATEVRVVQAIDGEFRDLWPGQPIPHEFFELKTLFLSAMRGIQRLSLVCTDTSLLLELPWAQPLADPLAAAHDRFVSILEDAAPAMRNWSLVLCVDEAESLSPWQQRCLNSFIRRKKAPWGYVVAFIEGVYDTRGTTIHAQNLGGDDYQELVSLDGNRRDFEQIATGAVALRLSRLAGESPPLSSILGHLSTNALLDWRLKHSEKPQAADLLREASMMPLSTPTRDDPPILEAWMARQKAASGELPRPDSNEQKSQGKIRKMHLATYHEICRSLRLKPIYAGENAVVGLSDYCIRDLLRILHFAWSEEFGVPAEGREVEAVHRLARATPTRPALSIESQNRGIRSAMDHKLGELPLETPRPQLLTRLVKNLGSLRAALLIGGASEDVGVFVMDSKNVAQLENLAFSVEEGVFCGVLFRDVDARNSDRLLVRLHNLAAPMFGLPYRRPHQRKLLSPALLEALSSRDMTPDGWLRMLDEPPKSAQLTMEPRDD